MAIQWLKLRPKACQQGFAASWIILAGFSLGVLLVLYLPTYLLSPSLLSTSFFDLGGRAPFSSYPASGVAVNLLPAAILSAAVVTTIVLRQLRFKALYLASASATAGAFLVLIVSGISAKQQLATDAPTDFKVTGHIASLPELRGRKLQVIFQIDRGEVCRLQSLPCRLLLSWYRDRQGTLPELKPGQQWSLTVRAKPPRNYANPGGFDYAHWLAGQGIHATAYVRSRQPYQLTGKTVGGQINRVRQQLASQIRLVLPAKAPRSLVLGLAVGVRSEIDPQTRQLLQDTGTAHLLAISGMHIGMVSGFAFVLARVIWWLLFLPLYKFADACAPGRMQPGLMAANRSYFAGVAALLAAFAYALAAGFSLPTQRALLMLLVFVLLRMLQRRVALRHVLLIVLVVALLFDPLAPLFPGIWLSFGAVVALMWLGSGRVTGRVLRGEDTDQDDKNTSDGFSFALAFNRWREVTVFQMRAVYSKCKHHITRAFLLQLSLSFLLFPLTIVFFKQGSVVSPIANFFAIPLVGFIVLPLVLLGITALGLGLLVGAAVKPVFSTLAKALLVSAERCLEFLTEMLEWCNQWSFAAISFPDTAIVAAAFALLGCLCITKPRGGRIRWLALPLLLPLLVQLVTLRQPGLRVHVLDVGQGLSVVVETRRQVLLYDTGIGHTDVHGEGFSLVKTVLRPFLRSQGLPGPQVAVVSHSDNDHAGGLAALRRYYPDVRVIAPAAFTELAADEACEQGKHWSWNGVEFQLLYPGLAEMRAAATLSDNDLSCVLLIRYGRSTILLPGDIEAHAEERLVEVFKQSAPYGAIRQKIDVLVAPHHGSSTSSSEKFVGLLRPRFAVFSMGWANRYGFPDSSVVLRYKSVGTKIFRTDESGAVRFDFDRQGLLRIPQEYRRQRRRIWSLW